MRSSRVLASSFLQNVWIFLVLNGELWACTIYCKSSHKTVRISIKWLMAEAKIIYHLCMYFWGISLSYFSNQVFWSMLPVPDFCVLYVRFWMSPALIHRVLPLARIISLAWIFSMTNPLPNFIPPAASECFKTPGHHYGFWEATVLCTGSASGAGRVSPGAFSPLWLFIHH